MEDSKRIKKINNKGFSLVELLVVIGLMAILIGGISIGFAVITNSYAREAATYTTDALGLARTKASSVTADEWTVTITHEGEDDGYTISVNKVTYQRDSSGAVITDSRGNTLKTAESIESYRADSDLLILYRDGEGNDSDASTIQVLGVNSPLTIRYNVGQGSVNNVFVSQTEYPLGYVFGKTLSDVGSIIIRSGDFSRTIELYHATGKYDIIDD